jgi:asparagine synthase (glutamine-hydrolysing)
MSGIYGILNFKGNPVDKHALETMEKHLIHRAIDGKDIWCDKNIGLGHVKMIVTPESEFEQLPYTYKHLIITADCRIDNREELYPPLSIETFDQEKITDPELIVIAYDKWGKDCVKHLIGDFTFAIWDKLQESLFVARDHMGVRPLYYHNSTDNFVFSSELRSILQLPFVSDEICDSHVYEMLYSSCPYSKITTFYKDILRLEPAHYLFIVNNNVDKVKYWDFNLNQEIIYDTEEEYIVQARELLEEAVKCRMRTKFPIGSQLSGGLDSSMVSVLANKQANAQKLEFSVYSNVLMDELLGKVYPFIDEREYINEVCEKAGIKDVNYLDYRDKTVEFFIDEQVKKHDGLNGITIFSSIIQAHTEVACRKNVRIMLSGFTGDEVVTNFASRFYRELAKKMKWFRLFKELRLDIEPQHKSILKSFIYWNLMAHMPNIAAIIFNIKSSFKKKQPQIYAFNDEMLKDLEKRDPFPKSSKTVKEYQYKLITHPFDVYRFESENLSGMLNNITLAYPLADIRLTQFFLSVTPTMKRKNGVGRYLARKSMEGILPELILNRNSYSRHYILPSNFYIYFKKIPKLLLDVEVCVINKFTKSINKNYLRTQIEALKLNTEIQSDFTIAMEIINYYNNLIKNHSYHGKNK